MLSFVDSPQSKVATLWEPVHGEPRITFPALTEIATVLWEMGIYPDIEMLPPTPPRAFDTIEETLDEIRRMMFLIVAHRNVLSLVRRVGTWAVAENVVTTRSHLFRHPHLC